MKETELIKLGNSFLKQERPDRQPFFLLTEEDRKRVVSYLLMQGLVEFDQKGNILINKKGFEASKLGLKKYLRRTYFNENINRYGFYISSAAFIISFLFNLYFILFSKN